MDPAAALIQKLECLLGKIFCIVAFLPIDFLSLKMTLERRKKLEAACLDSNVQTHFDDCAANFGHRHLSLKKHNIEFDINAPVVK